MDIIGAGWAFPLQLDLGGKVLLATGDDELEQSIRLILGTAPGERPMRPDFGCRIAEEVFSPADATTAGRLAFYVRQALERWEPRIDVVEVAVSFDPGDAGVLYVQLTYQPRGSYDPRALVLPFYVIPADEPSEAEIS